MVSVIIPAFNREEMLLRAVNSVIEQSQEGGLELVVVDDGSTESLQQVKRLLDSQDHSFVRTANTGPAHARNFGVRQSSGDWIAFLDSDDSWLPGKLNAQLDYLAANPTLRICQCEDLWYRNGRRVNKKEYHQMPKGDVFSSSLERCLISPSSVILERSLFEALGGFDEDMLVCEDYDLWLRLSSQERVGLLEEALVVKHGGHADQLSKALPAMDRFRVYALLKLLNGGEVSKEQTALVVAQIEKKTSVLLQGAEKRKSEMVELYLDILSFVRAGGGDSEPLVKILSVLKQDILRAKSLALN